MSTPKIIADLTLQLASKITVGGTIGTLASNLDDDGVTLPDGLYYFTLDGSSSNKEHISCTKTGVNLTNIKTVSRQGVETAGVLREHRIGASVVMTDFATYKAYMDTMAIQGAPDASVAVKGIGRLSTPPVSVSDPIFVGDNDTRIPTTDIAAAFDGSQGTPNANNKFVTQDNLHSSETDQTQTTQNSSVEFGMANTTGNKNKIQQSFIPAKTKTRGVKLYKAADTGTFTGTVTIALYADSAGSPTGSALATITLTNAQWLALAVGEFEADFSAEYSMTTGSLYWIQASASTADNSNHPNLGVNTAGGYASGSVKYWNTTDTYVAIANIDLYFKTLQGIVSQVVETNTSGGIPSYIINNTTFSIPVFQQVLQSFATSTINAVGSNQDGSVLYNMDGANLRRMARDPITGIFLTTHSVTPTGNFPSNAASTGSILVIGNYVYLFGTYTGVSPYYVGCYRYNAADLTNPQAMTIPNITSNSTGTVVNAWTDGTYIYVSSSFAGLTVTKLSLSGTTFTQVATGGAISGIVNSQCAAVYDGTNIYLYSYGLGLLYKANDVYFSAPTSTSLSGFPLGNSAAGTGIFGTNTFMGHLINIDSKRLYFGIVSNSGATSTGTQYPTYRLYLLPISKP